MKGQVKIVTVILLIGITVSIIAILFTYGEDIIDVITEGIEEDTDQQRMQDLASISITDYWNESDNIHVEITNTGQTEIDTDELNIYFNDTHYDFEKDFCPSPIMEPGESCIFKTEI